MLLMDVPFAQVKGNSVECNYWVGIFRSEHRIGCGWLGCCGEAEKREEQYLFGAGRGEIRD